jgi:hypothetical protein
VTTIQTGGAWFGMAMVLVLLGIGSSSLIAVLTSALIFGVSFMAGSAVLAIWTAQLARGRATLASP